MTRTWMLLAALFATVPLAGCGSSTRLPATAQGDAAQAEFTLVTDIPIPSGASMDNERSLILSDRDRWTGRVVMKTLFKSAGEITGFYQSQMPNYGWEPVMSVTTGTSVLSYVRGDRAATVQIEERTLMGAVVSVTVAPKQTGSVGGGSYGGPPPASPGAQTPVRAEPLR
jgi:hypothetical protein